MAAIAVAAFAAAACAAPAAAEKPLRLHATTSGRDDGPPVSLLRGRYVTRLTPDNRLIVRDDQARLRYNVSIRGAGPALYGCHVADIRTPDALLRCLGDLPSSLDTFVLVNLPSGTLQTLPTASDSARGPLATSAFGARIGDSFTWLGREWIRGMAADPSLTHLDAIYLSRRNGRRVQHSGTDQLYNADAQGLPAQHAACQGAGRGPFAVPDPRARAWLHRRTSARDPKGDLLLMRCGRRPQLISRCPVSCLQPAFNHRVVTWLAASEQSLEPSEVVVRAIRSGRVYRRDVETPSALGATPTRVVVTQTFSEIESIDIVGVRSRETFGTTELRIPASVR